MGIFALKRHFKINHIVAKEGDVVLIGSAYVRDLISIFPDGEIVGNRTFLPFKNDNLERYWTDFHADKQKVFDLLAERDQFEFSTLKPVFTYKNGHLSLHFCEEYGFPNVTTDGHLMYENLFFKTAKEARAAAILDAKHGILWAWRTMKDATSRALRGFWRLAKEAFHLVGYLLS